MYAKVICQIVHLTQRWLLDAPLQSADVDPARNRIEVLLRQPTRPPDEPQGVRKVGLGRALHVLAIEPKRNP